MSDFPKEQVLLALRDVLRWILEYEPPPGEAVSGQVNVIVTPQNEGESHG